MTEPARAFSPRPAPPPPLRSQIYFGAFVFCCCFFSLLSPFIFPWGVLLCEAWVIIVPSLLSWKQNTHTHTHTHTHTRTHTHTHTHRRTGWWQGYSQSDKGHSYSAHPREKSQRALERRKGRDAQSCWHGSCHVTLAEESDVRRQHW